MIARREFRTKDDSSSNVKSKKKHLPLAKRIFSLLLALLIVSSHFPLEQVLAYQDEGRIEPVPIHEQRDEIDLSDERQFEELEAVNLDDLDSITIDDLFVDPSRAAEIQARRANLDVLTQTLGDSLGAVGFEDEFTLPLGDELIDVEIHFVTPSATALRLLSENNIELGRNFAPTLSFEEIALSAHAAFEEQLGSVAVPFGSSAIDIYQSHHLYWNGVFARVPASSVETIALLAEVFAVTPITIAVPLDPVNDETELEFFEYEILEEESEYAAEEVTEYVDEGFVPTPQIENTAFDLTYQFNLSVLEQFEIERIRNELELDGAGIQIAVLDTGIDWMHPQFESHRIPSLTSPTATDPRFGDHANYAVRGWDHVRNNPYPLEGLPEDVSPWGGSGATSHGTHVAGTLQAIAPGATFYHYRVLHGSTPWNIIAAGVERSILDGADIVNMSLGGSTSAPVDSVSHMVNVASLDGVLFVIAAGNDGPNPQTIGTPAIASLALTVANGQLGGWQFQQFNDAAVNGNHALIQLHAWGPGVVVDDYLASLMELDVDGNAAFTWFGQLSDLPELPTPAWLDANFPGLDLTGRVAVINRGGTTFTSMRAFAQAVNASALIIVNNQADNTFLSGTTIGGFFPANQIPIFSVRLSDSAFFGGSLATVPNPPVEGVVNFGELGLADPPPNILNPDSSRGPLAEVSHIKPDVTGPGANIFSAVPTFWQYPNNSELWGDYSEAYALFSGTSMASPAVAGIAALMLEQNPGFYPYEVKARIMNTAFPVGVETSNYSVFDTGAGYVDPWRALTQDAFATTEVNIPWEASGNFDVQTMSSLSFGVVPYGSSYSNEITIEVHGGGEWVPTAQFNTLQPNTQFVLVDYTATTFTYRFEFAENALGGISDGNIILTNGSESMTLPFAVNYVNVLGPVEVHSLIGVTRPIVSNFVRTNADELDPRDFSSHVMGAITPSNFSNAYFGFTDPNPSPSGRVVEFYYAQYDEDGIETGFWYIGAFNFPQGSTLVLTDFVAGVLGNTPLPEGILTFYAFINDTWHPQEVEIGRFIVTGIRPEITFNEDVFTFDATMSNIPIEAQVYSWAHELAIEEDIRTAAFTYTSGPNFGQHPVFDYRFTFIDSNIGSPAANSNGAVNFNVNVPSNPLDFVIPSTLAEFTVIDGDSGIQQNIGGGASIYVGAHISLPEPLQIQY